MKITYLKEAFGKIEKLKRNIDKKLTGEDIRREAMELMIQPVLEDRDFLLKCGNCFKSFIHVNANTTPPGVLDFRYTGLKDGVLSVVCDAHYTGNASQRNHATAKSVLIENEMFEKMSEAEIREEIDDYVTKYLWQYFKKKNPDVLNTIKSVHVEKINLWSNCPESVNGIFPSKLTVKIKTEWYGNKLLTDKELEDLFEKVRRIFTFCAKEVVLEKGDARVDKLGENAIKVDVQHLLDLSEYEKYDNNKTKSGTYYSSSNNYSGVSYQYDSTFNNKSKKYLKKKYPALIGYMPIKIERKIDLRSYIASGLLDNSDIAEAKERCLPNNLWIISTANQKEIEKINGAIIAYGGNLYNSNINELEKAIAASGIEYVAIVTEFNTSWQGQWVMITDFINGKFNNSYKLNNRI